MSNLIEDCLKIIFNELQYDSHSLHSCILVNKLWCRTAMPILWKNTSTLDKFSRRKLYNIIIYLLPTFSKKLLFDHIVELPLPKLSGEPLFNYISFFSRISPNFINNMSLDLINYQEIGFNKFQEEYKKYLLEQEVYKLFINNCKNIKFFNWKTTQPLSQYQGASTCFSQLCTLNIDLQFVTSTALFGMAQICQNIEHLDINNCNQDIPGLINFIDIQKNLKSLYLHFKGVENQCIQLSKVIERKAHTIKKFGIRPIITLLSPKFLPSLINLQHLELYNDCGHEIDNSLEMQEWDKYLSITSFPNLQYLEIAFLPSCKDYMLIEKSHGNILEINIYRSYIIQDPDPVYNNQLIKAIAKCCPKIERLTIDAELENLEGIKEIFLNCTQLKMIDLSTNNEKKRNCDKLLEILMDYSPKSLCEFSFFENWIFTVEGLENFFENWRERRPLIFNKHYNGLGFFTDKHRKVVKKYFDKGVIKETNC
ncbi:hypothetical protein C1645_839220 [Glomus cerebriforme]|uniref:F-box domain-containing protein n=1 Tax=Glomus cerebriforme TaxID=658196 RepID=A0A397S616_9GLOM|nr:hypothetical protein C1645_839220 [Glomus cerebriforme]